MGTPADGRGDGVVVRQVDAFTDTPFEGNPAGVVLQADGLTERQMRAIAREMNLSETAFLLAAGAPGADLRIRWFTPTSEVTLCGHATVATFHAALESGRLQPGRYTLECLSGLLPVEVSRTAQGRARVRMGVPVPELVASRIATCRLAEALGVAPDDLDARRPVLAAGEWLVACVNGLEVLRRMKPDVRLMRELHDETGQGSFIALTSETVEPASGVHLRMFAPGWGIDEDPVTGAAQGPVAAWLAGQGLLPGPGGPSWTARYVAEQGDEVGRPGRIEVEVAIREGRVGSITIAGGAVTVLEGWMAIPPDR